MPGANGLHAPQAAGPAQVCKTDQDAATDWAAGPAESAIAFGPFRLLPVALEPAAVHDTARRVAPSDLTTEFVSVDDGHVVWSVTIVPPQGRPYVETFEVPADGEAYPIGSDTTASLRLTGDTLHVTFEGSAGQSDAFTCTLSSDHRTMTCRGVLDEGNGRTTQLCRRL